MSENTEKKTSKNSNYLSAKESRRISRENRRITTAMEKKYQRKKVPESEYLTQMRDPKNVVEFDDLHTYFFTDTGTVKAVDGVSFDVPQGVTVGVVGESGCGKSVTSLSLMQLLQRPQVFPLHLHGGPGDDGLQPGILPGDFFHELYLVHVLLMGTLCLHEHDFVHRIRPSGRVELLHQTGFVQRGNLIQPLIPQPV